MIEPPFFLSEEAPEGLHHLLETTALGTAGARYEHLNHREVFERLDHPLHLYVKRRESLLGNITFCRRKEFWYIRYFAFRSSLQANQKSRKNKLNRLELHCKKWMELQLHEKRVEQFYAYIEPKNSRSLHMAHQFGFTYQSSIKSQTFTRFQPQIKYPLTIESLHNVQAYLRDHFKNLPLFTESQLNHGNYYVLRKNQKIAAIARATKGEWRWHRFPGKMGGFHAKILPFLPYLNRLIHPANHRFIALDCVIIEDETILMDDFFESILSLENSHFAFWWVSEHNGIFRKIASSLAWGPIHRLFGASEVHLMHKGNAWQGDFFVNGLDLI